MHEIVIAGAGLLAVFVSWGDRRRDHVGEFYALLTAAGGGMLFFVSATNLMTLFLGLEWFSISLYVLTALETGRRRSLEAGLKYLIVGSFGSAVLLFGWKRKDGELANVDLWQRLAELAFPNFFGDASRPELALYFGWGIHDRDYPYLLWIAVGLPLLLLAIAAWTGRGVRERASWILIALRICGKSPKLCDEANAHQCTRADPGWLA